MSVYRITTYMDDGTNGWTLTKKCLYDDLAKFTRQRVFYKKKMNTPVFIPMPPPWNKWLSNPNYKTAWSGKWRVVSEELQNGQWTVIEDWIQP